MTPIASCRNVISIKHAISAVFEAFCFVKGRIVIVLFLQIFNTQVYILFKISASSLYANFSLDFLVEKSAIELNHISEISKPWIMFKKTPMHHPHRLTYFHRNPAPDIIFSIFIIFLILFSRYFLPLGAIAPHVTRHTFVYSLLNC